MPACSRNVRGRDEDQDRLASACARAATWCSSSRRRPSTSRWPTTCSVRCSATAQPERYGAAASRHARANATRAAGHHHAAHDGAATVAQPVKIDNDLYVRDYSKCILCYKCVEACGTDAQNTFAIAVAGRGFDAHISTEYDVPLPDSACVYCGNCIGVCPTGALMFKTEHDMRAAGSGTSREQTKADTICSYCGVGCTLTLHVQDNEIVKVTSPIEHDVTQRPSVHQGPLRVDLRLGKRRQDYFVN